MESPHFLWRRLQVSHRLGRVAIPAYLAYMLFLAIAFQDLLPAGSAPLWAAVSLAVGLGWMGSGWFHARSKKGRSTGWFQLAEATFAFALSLSYSWFLVFAFPGAPVAGQLALAGFTVALAALGAFVLTALPWSAALWLAGLSFGFVGSTVLGPGGLSLGALLLAAGFLAVLVLLIGRYHRAFVVWLRAETELAHQSQLVELLLHDFGDGSEDWIWETDPQGRLRRITPALALQWGRSAAELDQRSMVDTLVQDPADLTIEEEEELSELDARLSGTNAFHDLEVPAQIGSTHRRWKLSGKPLLDELGTVVGWRGVGTDVTEVQRLNNLNARLALLDNLTGLANRHRLQAILHDNLTPREGIRPCGLILIDVQNFRMVNEGLGHDVGDDLLREIALRLRTRVPPSTLLARLGGDEFALVAPGAGEAALEGLISALGSACDDPFQIAGHRLEISFQMGVATSPRDATDATELLKCAELALHEAKLSRQGSTVAYQAAFSQRARDRIRLHGELKVALVDQQFELHFQPQIRVWDGGLVGCEALVRWRHPVRGMVSPAEFIPALEETGLIVPVGIWILEAACREALTWPEPETVAVNVSAVQFASRSFRESVQEVLRTTGFPGSRLELEITESVMAQDPKQVIQTLQGLRALGISISLDDFGTGYSSLSYLRTLPLDKLKIDQSFVRVLGQDPNAAAIVRTVLELSRLMGLRTTAEGVETEAQRAQLASMGCDSIQGYLYSKPLPPQALREFRAARSEG